ncbi:MAG: aminopeptidase P family protein [Oligoflexia bacterium]|nr:aminopeptidase P family protein [Oligoflexia bacterium]
MKWRKYKRKQMARSLPKSSVLVLSSLPQFFRQVDVSYPYRQESNFYYLTGFEQAESLFLLFPSARSVLFIQDKNPLKEIWDGPLYTVKEAQKKYGIDEVYSLSQLDEALPKKLRGVSKVFYDSNSNSLFDKKMRAFKFKKKESAFHFLKNFRRIKEREEISSIQKACSCSIQAHKQVAKALRPNTSERALHGVFIQSIMEQGSDREAYQGIFACGANATVLHYVKNHSICKKGELLLVDAGAEYGYYSSDISRVYPVSGRFSKNQKKLYTALLKLQKQLIKEVKPEVTLKSVNQKMNEGITQILLEFGLLKGSLKKNLKLTSHRKYCPHSVGHLLGLDVHDVTFKKGESGVLKNGMVLTIEPGIYIHRADKQAPEDLRAVGLRIEDDILVTQTGQKNLTKKLPKEVEEIEELCS